jgi:hypothetical protein
MQRVKGKEKSSKKRRPLDNPAPDDFVGYLYGKWRRTMMKLMHKSDFRTEGTSDRAR